MQTPFSHEDGKISGTKIAFSMLVFVFSVRIMGAMWGYPELDLGGAAALLGAAGAVYAGRRFTEKRYQFTSTQISGGDYEQVGPRRPRGGAHGD